MASSWSSKSARTCGGRYRERGAHGLTRSCSAADVRAQHQRRRRAAGAGDGRSDLRLSGRHTLYPCRLVLGWRGMRPLHAVAATSTAATETIVITVYRPDPVQWEAGFKRRQP